MRLKVTLHLRIRLADGTYRYARPAYSRPGHLKSLYAEVCGKPECHPEGIYYLRYTRGKKRIWEAVGSDPTVAMTKFRQTCYLLEGQALGIPSPGFHLVDSEPENEPEPEPESKPEAEKPSGSSPNRSRSLIDLVNEYLDEIKEHRTVKTHQAYSLTLRRFLKVCRKKTLGDVTRQDMMDFITSMHRSGLAPRTVRNRVDNFQIFLHHCGLDSILKKNDRPKYTKKKVSAYTTHELSEMFSHADIDEADLLHFLLCTGVREQEAEFATWPDVNFDEKTYTITEHRDLGFVPKDKEEGSVPIPDSLVDRLTARHLRYPRSRLIFARADGKPNCHLLRVIKDLALRAGVNCGHCINKKGQFCAITQYAIGPSCIASARAMPRCCTSKVSRPAR